MSQPVTKTDARDLPVIQRWMQAVIMHADGVAAGLQSPAAQGQLPIAPAELEQLIGRSKSQTSIERLEIYANAYYARLLECLRDEFPTLVHILGEDTFNGFAYTYLQSYPSKSYTLGNLSRQFGHFLRETRPDDIDPDTADWPDFLIDLATVERTYREVFDGPGTENSRILTPEDLAAVSPEAFAGARLIAVPCLRFLQLRYPVHQYITSIGQNEDPPVPPPSPTNLVITRREYVVRRNAVSDAEFQLLSALADGENVGAAIEGVANSPDVDEDQLIAQLQTWFHQWAAAAYFQAIETSA